MIVTWYIYSVNSAIPKDREYVLVYENIDVVEQSW